MQAPSQLTRTSFLSLTASLVRFGNKLNTPHRMALHSLLDAMSNMAEGKLQGRWAFGLPTGTGKTRAIIEWATAVHKLDLPFTLAVSASRIEALCTLKREMIENGIPEEKIGLLHDDAKASMQATADNDDRPFMLITHQRIRSKRDNLSQYNSYKGQPRHLLLYDESLMVSDVQSFDYVDLRACLSDAIVRTEPRGGNAPHIDIHNYLVDCKRMIEGVHDNYDDYKDILHCITTPPIDPKITERYAREWESKGTISNFLRVANFDLRMLKSGNNNAVVSYRIVVPEELTNILVLDASYPIRKLCLLDDTIGNAETLPSVKNTGVKSFHSLKQFDNVTLYRLRSFGGRHSMEQRFKDRSMVKEVVEVLKTIPDNEAALFYLYKVNQTGTNYRKILEREITKAGIDLDAMTPDGKPRITITTWGNETSLNSYSYCSHVFLVGILHRDDTDLMASYLAQTQDIKGEVNKTIANELQLSEKSHLAYQALSRGTCRTVSDGKALPMKGYIVEIDPEIETTLTKVMPGVVWKKWEPFFVPESEGLVEVWSRKVLEYLAGVDDSSISSKRLKQALKAEKVAPKTWTRIIQAVSDKGHSSKESMTHGSYPEWKLEGRSLVKNPSKSLDSLMQLHNPNNIMALKDV